MKTIARVAAVAAVIATVALAVVYGPALARYIAFGVLYGDWLNDWITHLPVIVRWIARLVITGG